MRRIQEVLGKRPARRSAARKFSSPIGQTICICPIRPSQHVLVEDINEIGVRHGRRELRLGRILIRSPDVVERLGNLSKGLPGIVFVNPVADSIRVGNAIEEGDVEFGYTLTRFMVWLVYR